MQLLSQPSLRTVKGRVLGKKIVNGCHVSPEFEFRVDEKHTWFRRYMHERGLVVVAHEET